LELQARRATAPQIEIKNTDFVDMTSVISLYLSFSQNQNMKSAKVQYIKIKEKLRKPYKN
jgi:hypothetical protein